MKIRTATPADLEAVAAIEAACFPPAEAAGRASLAGRLDVYPGHFWLLEEGDQIVGFVNGMCTDAPDLADAMYDDPTLHQEDGAWQMIFGVDTLPAYRRQGCAARLLEHVLAQARASGQALSGLRFGAIFASPLHRACRTAEIIAGYTGGAQVVTAQAGQSFSVGDGSLQVLADGVETDNYNDLSQVLLFESGELSVLLSGDGEKPVEQAALEAEELERVLRAVASLRVDGCEYTVEAGRPDVFTREKLDVCAEYGVTRICINAQSFSDKTLEAIGRKHTSADLYRAFEMAKDYPFAVNCDLIAGLTGESVEEFCASVDAAVALSPENVTVHTLCLKKGAKLKEETARLEAGRLAEMIGYSRRALTAAGYEPYYLYRQKYMAGAHENVGWTKPGHACVYNIDVMEEIADNLAVGGNAVSKKLFLREGRIERHGSPKDIPTYLAKVGRLIAERNELFGG